MNTRPTRAPAPPAETAYAEPEESSFTEVEQRVSHATPAVRAQASNALPSEGPVQQPELPHTSFAKLAGAIAAVMAEIKPVEKSGWNDFHKYNYAKMGDLSIELTPLMGRHGIVIFQNEVDRAMFDEGKVISVRYQFTIVHSSGEIWPERPLITGMSRCRDNKGGFDDKSFNKAHTAARKYFLLSLFQIPTDDEHPDADDSGGQQQHPRPQGQRRPVPAPDGKLPPHLIAIVDGEAPAAWATRFNGFVAKAETAAEVDKWYGLNSEVFGKLKGRFPEVYDSLLDAMDARIAAFDKPTDDKISSGPANTGFPGDTKMVAKEPVKDDGEIPWALDRKLSDSDRDWLMSLKEAWAQCTDVEQIAAEQESIMAPAKEAVSPYVWQRACNLMDQQIERVQRG